MGTVPKGTALIALLLAACAPLQPATTTTPPTQATSTTAKTSDLTPYLQALSDLAPGDPTRQAAALTSAQAAWLAEGTAANTLRYALALGCAGHPSSNPVEAKRILTDLLASPNDLSPPERQLAETLAREFDARVALYAELARQREETQRQQTAEDLESNRRANALAAENARLKKTLAEAERQLEAVTEMERQLLEQAGEAAAEPPTQR